MEKKEIFSKSEMLHHFENLMPRNEKGNAKYVGDSNFLATCAKQGLIKLVSRRQGYVFVKPFISKSDIDNLIEAIKAGYKSQNNKQLNKKQPRQITEKDLDNFIKLVAETGLYEIKDGKVYKKTEAWVEL